MRAYGVVINGVRGIVRQLPMRRRVRLTTAIGACRRDMTGPEPMEPPRCCPTSLAVRPALFEPFLRITRFRRQTRPARKNYYTNGIPSRRRYKHRMALETKKKYIIQNEILSCSSTFKLYKNEYSPSDGKQIHRGRRSWVIFNFYFIFTVHMIIGFNCF